MRSAHPYLVHRKERGEKGTVAVEVATGTAASVPLVRIEWHTHTLLQRSVR